MNNPIYIVKSGDTYWDIADEQLGDAQRYTEIASLNPSVNPNNLKVGSRLKLPADAKMAKPPKRILGPLTADSGERPYGPQESDYEFKPQEKTFDITPGSYSSSTAVVAQCEANVTTPCCLDSISLKCSHGQELKLPISPNKKSRITLVADAIEERTMSGRCEDPLQVLIESRKCHKGKKDSETSSPYPLVTLSDADNKKTQLKNAQAIKLYSPPITMVDSLEYFFDHFLFLDKSKSLANKYTLDVQMCRGDQSQFQAEIYVYPKIKWDGSITFGYDLEAIEFQRHIRRRHTRDHNKQAKKSGDTRLKTANMPQQANKHGFSVDAALTFYYGSQAHTLTLPYKRSMSRQQGWGGKFIAGLEGISHFKSKLGDKLQAKKSSWLEIDVIGPNFTIAGNETLSESTGLDKPLHEANIELNALMGLEGTFKIVDAALAAMKNSHHPGLKTAGKIVSAVQGGGFYSEKKKIGIKANFKLDVIVSFTVGGRSVGNSDNDAMAVFTKPAGGEWGFKEGSIALEFGLKLDTGIDATIGLYFSVEHVAIEGGGETKVSIQMKVHNNAQSGEKVCKLYFHCNGLKAFFQAKVDHKKDRKGNKGTNSNDGVTQGNEEEFQQTMQGGGSNALSAKAKARPEYPIIKPFTLPSDGITLFTFGGGE